jgi:uncharacterized protein (TIGR02453 family)
MSYFGPEFTRFFRGLARHNTRAWYQAHRDEFVRYLKEPFEDFVGEMIERVAALDPSMRCEPKEAIFRLARDTRFSNDKTPYKTHLGAVIAPDGRKTRAAAFYVELGAGGLGIATGVYQPDKAQLYAIRETIRDDGASLERLLTDRAFRRLFGELQGDRNVRLPPEFAAAARRFPLLYQKQFYTWAEYPDPATIERRDLAEFVMRHYRAGRAVNAWFTRALARAAH